MKARWTWINLKARWTATQLRACLSLLQGWYLRWMKDTTTATAETHWQFTKYLPELNTTRWTDYVDPGYWTPEHYAWPGIRTRADVTTTPTAAPNETPTAIISLTAQTTLELISGVPSSYVVADYWTPDDYTLRGIRDSVTATLNP